MNGLATSAGLRNTLDPSDVGGTMWQVHSESRRAKGVRRFVLVAAAQEFAVTDVTGRVAGKAKRVDEIAMGGQSAYGRIFKLGVRRIYQSIACRRSNVYGLVVLQRLVNRSPYRTQQRRCGLAANLPYNNGAVYAATWRPCSAEMFSGIYC